MLVGFTPDAPYAARSLRLESPGTFGMNDSFDRSQETLPFG